MTTLGEMLVDARKAAGYSVQDVAHRTRIMLSAIQALEDDNLKALPSAAGYVRGYILSYCRLVGVDPRPYLAQYDLQSGNDRQDSMGRLPIDRTADRHSHGENEMNWKVVAIIAAAIVLVLIVVYLVGGIGGNGLSRLPLLSGETTSTANTGEDTRTPFSFSVEAKEGRATEVEVITDGVLAYRGALTSGDIEDFEGALEAKITIKKRRNAIVTQNGTNIPIPEDGELTLTAPEQ